MNNNSFFAFISRMKYINRWGLMHNSRFENLSEHSYETAVIAGALANIENQLFGGNYDAEKITVHALFHDCAEIITGDLPTPIKYYNPEIKNVYKDIEQVAQNRLLCMLPDDLRSEIAPLYTPSDEIRQLIKAADKISALIKCIEEKNSGNREFSSAEEATLNAINDMNLPEAQIFLDEFMHSFALTLDECTK